MNAYMQPGEIRIQDLPKGLSKEQFQWLERLGETSQRSDRDRLLSKYKNWVSKDFVDKALQSLRTELPIQARRWLHAGKGLVYVAEKTGVQTLVAKALILCGNLTRISGQKDAATELYTQTQQHVEPISDEAELPAIHYSLGIAYTAMKLPREAARFFESAFNLFQKAGDSRQAAICKLQVAELSLEWGVPPADVLRAYQSALRDLQGSGRLRDIGLCHQKIGNAYTRMGSTKEALNAYKQAIEIFKQSKDEEGLAVCLLNAGTVFARLGYVVEALQAYETALQAFATSDDPMRFASCLLNMGNLFRESGMGDRALQYYHSALAIYKSVEDEFSSAMCLTNIGVVFQDMAQTAEQASVVKALTENATKAYIDADKTFKSLGELRSAARCELNRGVLERHSGQYLQAVQRINKARSGFQFMNDARGILGCDLEIGHVYLLQNDYGQAVSVFQKAAEEAKRQDDIGSEASAHLGKGDAFKAQNRLKEALLSYLKALECIEQLRERIKDPVIMAGSSFRFDRLTASLAATSVRLDQSQQAFEYLQRSKGISLQLSLIGHLQAKQATRTIDLSHLSKLLNSETALIELAADDEHLCAFILTNRDKKMKMETILIPITRSDIEALVSGYIREIVRSVASKQLPDKRVLNAGAFRLFQILIEPLQPKLNGISSLIICPDGFLNRVPFHALVDNNNRYLIEDYTITLCTSVSVWAVSRELSNRNRSISGRKPLLIGVSKFKNKEHEPLPSVEKEIQTSRKLLGTSTQVLLNGEATKKRVLSLIPKAGLLHFSTHAGGIPSAPFMSSIVLYPGNQEDFLSVYEICRTGLQSHLSLLSACETMKGRAGAEGVLGLSWAFQIAGCPTTVASLWSLLDSATPEWVEVFYTGYVSGKSIATSFAEACRHMIQTNKRAHNISFSHPFVWGAWVLAGSDQ